jgi:hypothetical protein
MLVKNGIQKQSSTKEDLTVKTLSKAYPLRGKAKDINNVMTFEDLQEVFTPNDKTASHLFESIVSFAVGIYLDKDAMAYLAEKGLIPPTMK